MFEDGPQGSHEPFNHFLSQVEGGPTLDSEEEYIHPGILDVMYKIRAYGNYFETTSKGGSDTAGAAKKIGRILQDEGFEVVENH